MYPEYDPNEQSLGQSFADILRGLKNPQAYQDAGRSLLNAVQLTPNVTESLGRGGVAQAIGTTGDLRDLRNTIQSYLPKSVQNFSNAAEFLTNPYAKALIQTAPTTEQTLDFVPRATAPYEGYKQHETLGEYIAPSLGYFGTKALKATKDLPIGMTIQDVTPPIEPVKVADALRQPEKNALGFYSPLDEAVSNLQNAKGTGQQYLAQLLKTQGVKQEEVATRGLDTFLENNPKVTREQMAQYLRENPVNLQETVLGAGSQRNLNSMNIDEYSLGEGRVLDDPDYIDNLAEDEFHFIKNEDPDLVNNYRTQAFEDLEINPATTDPSELSQVDDLVDDYIRDGARIRAEEMYYDNPYYEFTDDLGYRAVGNDDIGFHVTDPQGREISYRNNGSLSQSQAEDAIREDAVNNGLLHFDDEEYGTKYHDYTLPNGENYREVLIQYDPKLSYKDSIRELTPEDKQRLGVDTGVLAKVKDTWGYYPSREVAEMQLSSRLPKYESGHFDEPNILAHFRTTDRTIDGKKTLFVEEIQSDWHQAGRKKGYQGGRTVHEVDKDIDAVVNELRSKPNVKYAPSEEDWARHPELLAKYESLFAERASAPRKDAVPNAPFKKNWQELAMKRAMQMAAEGGYDRVAFTTGKQQADRYSLSKQISSVKYTEDGQLRAYGKNGEVVIARKLDNPEQLEDYIGKEAAKKLLDQPIETIKIPSDSGTMSNDGRQLSGVDLDVGGEGMKGFYDKILPDFINKYGKKHGLKVGQTNLESGRVIKDGNTGRFYVETNGKVDARNAFIDKADAEAFLKNTQKQDGVHYFDLTPEAKESFLKKGQPMFAAAPAVALTDEDTRRETLEKLFNSKK